MKIARMNPYHGESKTTAFFDLETDEGIVIKGFTLVDGPKGLFVSVPQDKGKDDKYYERVLIPNDKKKQLNEMALKAYEEIEI
ncbi:MAG: septation protein SpoVG family protein [Melioribacteraceae bacterium]|nr:septation protein SpoVG family protein [Melioribacteraceae bacterium]